VPLNIFTFKNLLNSFLKMNQIKTEELQQEIEQEINSAEEQLEQLGSDVE